MNNKRKLISLLYPAYTKFILGKVIKDIASIFLYMGLPLLSILSLLFLLLCFSIIEMPLFLAVIFSCFMMMATAIIFCLWNLLFHRNSLLDVATQIDKKSLMNNEIVYALYQKEESDAVCEYLAEKAISKQSQWNNQIKIVNFADIIKIIVIMLAFIMIAWLIKYNMDESIKNYVFNSSSIEKQQDQKQENQKQKDQKQQKQKQQDQKQQNQKQKDQKQEKQKQQNPKQGNQKQGNPKQENQNQENPKSNDKKNEKNGTDKDLPDIQVQSEELSPLFGDGKSIQSYANTGGKENNKDSLSEMQTYYQNLQKLPLFFNKQYIPINDQLAIQRYFNIIHPQQEKE